MTPRVLFLGGGKGSWAIRGVQIGTVLGARTTAAPTDDDWRWAQVIVLVKRAIFEHGARAATMGVPLVWDVLDFWEQPEENGRTVAEMTLRVRELAERYHVATLIGATQAMADAIGGVYIPHHARPRLKPLPVRSKVEVVAYEGTPKYLGAWKAILEESCTARGWRFVVNPASLNEADLVVALRDGRWDGDLCREWKSGIKLVNAITAGRPVITQPSAAVREIEPSGSIVETREQLDAALSLWAPLPQRQWAASIAQDRAFAFTRSSVAHLYREHVFPLARRAA